MTNSRKKASRAFNFIVKQNEKNFFRLFKFNLKLNFQMKNAIFCARSGKFTSEMVNEDTIYGAKDE